MAVLLAPAAGAGWSAYGGFEPDTSYDTTAFMWGDPPPVGGAKRVYFNVYSIQFAPPLFGVAAFNPNVGALETRNEIVNNEFHEALFGVWVDCNSDGYVGMAETAVREYHNSLLLDKTICPPKTGGVNRWETEGAHHNYNNVVSEFIPISRNTSAGDVRVFRDDAVMVWGDFHRPDERPFHRSCPLDPQPRGTYSSTGGLMNYIDCRVDIVGGIDTALNAAGGDPLGLGFSDNDDARSGPLGQVQTFGSEDSSRSVVRTQDCDAAPLFRSGDLFNESGFGGPTGDPAQGNGGTLHNNEIRPPPADPIGNTQDPTLPGQYNRTREEIIVLEAGPAHDCDTSNDRGADFYGGVLGEGDFNPVDPNNKREADWNFGFSTSTRGSIAAFAVSSGSAGADSGDLGVSIGGPGGSRWRSDSIWASKAGPRLVKADLGSQTAGLPDAYWLSFYAHVGAATRARGFALPGGSGEYGAWHCGGKTTGIHNGWNCDKNAWYVNPDGTLVPETAFKLARPGQAYHLRDVDCYDGSNAIGVPLQPAALGPNPCR